jgi:V8-like Glu-specific endopeptidase
VADGRNEGAVGNRDGAVQPAPDPDKELLQLFRERARSGKIGERALYWEDDRSEPWEMGSLSSDQQQALTRSLRATAMITKVERIPATANGYKLYTRSYRALVKDELGNEAEPKVCAYRERFAEQRLAGECSGVLVAPDVVATAGHCIKPGYVDEADPTRNRIRLVFGYRMSEGVAPMATMDFSKDAVRDIEKVIKRQFNSADDNDFRDFALLQLKTPVPASVAEPMRIGSDGDVLLMTRVGVIGYPYGLPLKYVLLGQDNPDRPEKAKVSWTSDIAFSAPIDGFQGNSGSPLVLAAEPDKLVGIFVRGRGDFVLDQQNNCAEPTVYTLDNDDKGEIAVRIGVIAPFLR